ncbi:unnamed protein product, partial [Rotaria sp. Silwood2]
MANTLETVDPTTELIYKFRFEHSGQSVHLTKKQLNFIPYLSTLVTNQNDVSNIQNQNGEYLLKSPIDYTSFMVILRSVTSDQPYILFNELHEDENVLNILELFNDLGVNSFSAPPLQEEPSILSTSISISHRSKHFKYRPIKNIFEARNTAAEFIIALHKKKYDLHVFAIKKQIFSLLMVIFSNSNIFSTRFRHHTFIVVKECFLYLFSEKQRLQLPTFEQIAQNKTIDSWIYLHDDEQPVPENLKNVFT